MNAVYDYSDRYSILIVGTSEYDILHIRKTICNVMEIYGENCGLGLMSMSLIEFSDFIDIQRALATTNSSEDIYYFYLNKNIFSELTALTVARLIDYEL